jgi:hypothetical protein
MAARLRGFWEREREMTRLLIRRMLRWFMFSLIVALLPIIFNALDMLASEAGLRWGLLLGQGELLLIAVGLYGPTLGEVLTMGERWEEYKIVVGGLCFMNTAVAAWYFATVSSKPANQALITSLVLYLFAVICSGCSVALVARRESYQDAG